MNIIKNTIKLCLIALMVYSCSQDDVNTDYVNEIAAPSNISAAVRISQDNSGLVTITPLGQGAVSFNINFGDDSDVLEGIIPGKSATHTYSEGTYEASIVAKGLNGLTTAASQTIVVSFKAPENLVVSIENDAAISKKVNVVATADYAMSYEVYFGEPGNDTPVSANIGETASYQYQEAGIYTIRVVAMSAAIETTEYVTEFEVTAILQPLTSAPAPPSRAASDVISIFSGAYTDVAGTNYFPDWGQAGQGSGWAMFSLDGDDMLQYINLSYQGIALADGTSVDVTEMEFLHLDVWTAEVVTDIETSLINGLTGTTEAPITKSLNPNAWTSIDIPISDYTDQGLSVNEIFQLKFVGTPWAAGTVFIDNIYFYKSASNCEAETSENIDPALGNINWTFMTKDLAHTFEPFGDITSSIVDNPLVDQVNPSCNVQSYIKTAGCQTWSGVGKGLTNAIDLTTSPDNIFKMKVFAKDHVTDVTLQLEFEPYPNTAPLVAVTQTMTKVGEWEELVFDFSAHTDKTFKSVIVYFDRDNPCDDASYYFDDLKQVNSAEPATCNPESVENIDPANGNINWTFRTNDIAHTFEAFGNIGAGIVENPVINGINSSCNVESYIKTAGCETWSGVGKGLTNAIDLTTNTSRTFSLMVLAQDHPTEVTLQLEFEPYPNTAPLVAITQTMTKVGEWEELVFDFSAHSDKTFKSVIIYFDRDNPCDDATYYFDNLKQY